MTDALDRRQDADEALPVVARLVIEIRSDGSRTVARGALEGASRSERVGVEARGGSPAELAGQLLRAIIASPVQAALARMTGLKGHDHPDSPEPAGLIDRVRWRAARAVRRGLRRP